MSVAILDVPPAVIYTVGAAPQSDFAVPFPFSKAADLRVLVGGGEALWSLVMGPQDSGLVLSAVVRLASSRIGAATINTLRLKDGSVITGKLEHCRFSRTHILS